MKIMLPLLRWAHRPLTLQLFAPFALPKHELLTMPSLSPTMKEGKILKWLVKPGQKIDVGDVIAEIETDKATMPFQVQDKGYIARVNQTEDMLQVGSPIAVIAKKEGQVGSFKDFKFDGTAEGQQSPATPADPSPATPAEPPPEAKQQKKPDTFTPSPVSKLPPSKWNHQQSSGMVSQQSSSRVIASPIAKNIANEKGIDLSSVTGSGPGGRILKQDVASFSAPTPAKQTVKPSPVVAPGDNPYEDIPLSSMRKTIANRLLESKQTVPHYYISDSIEMDAVMALRVDINKGEKENGVKVTVNDIIIKAMALALRDFPDVNVQWQGSFIRKFKHSDISVAVAIDGGLITPIVFKAETLGLLEIARKTKDLAKRAREGKLTPNEFQGGTSSVSNIGMFGIDSVASIINPPQASILGVGKTQKKLLWAEGDPPYRVAQVCQVIGSMDHRAVDGALGAQWLKRIKFYLQKPTNMLL